MTNQNRINSTTIESLAERKEIEEIAENLELHSLRLCKNLLLTLDDVVQLLNTLPPHVTLRLIADAMKTTETKKIKPFTDEEFERSITGVSPELKSIFRKCRSKELTEEEVLLELQESNERLKSTLEITNKQSDNKEK